MMLLIENDDRLKCYLFKLRLNLKFSLKPGQKARGKSKRKRFTNPKGKNFRFLNENRVPKLEFVKMKEKSWTQI